MMCLQGLVRLGVWSLLAVLIAGCGCSGDEGDEAVTTTAEVGEGEILRQDDFSDSTSGWATVMLEEGEANYVEGAYRIFVKQAGRQVWSNLEGPTVQGLRVDFEVTQLTGTSGSLVGARCYTDVDARAGYTLGVAQAEQGYSVSQFREDDYRLLESSGKAVDAIRPLGEENQLRVECIASADGPAVLTLTANGQALVRAEGGRRTPGFDGVGLFVDTTEGGAEALFDDFVLTELSLAAGAPFREPQSTYWVMRPATASRSWSRRSESNGDSTSEVWTDASTSPSRRYTRSR